MPIWSGSKLGGMPWDIPNREVSALVSGAGEPLFSLRQQGFEPEASVLLSVVPVPLLQEALVFIPEEDE